jgi:biopolymer transport protein ExbD
LDKLARENPRPKLVVTADKLARYDDVAEGLSLVQKADLQINMTANQSGK